ncbi:cytochrome b-c1 complex subunit 10 [Chiloscyllium plagiosum]|uniref:cytochrome b-c1 complex subunit 10 n=1 Tax=Chiloscyllium plagiosum TaxID=36176 RepID=UPI001CB82F58|nr:cytochrome b-c1 complex subunit 10 [Chiloscyllium plagiosum]
MRGLGTAILWCGAGRRADAEMLEKFIGPRYVQLVKNWIPTVATWGGVGCVALVYSTDWRLILDHVPYIRGKFKDE